jgi:hypothetical protein
MFDYTLHLTRPPPIPVVFDRVQDLPAVAVKELRRNEVILHRYVPPPRLAIMGVMNDWGIFNLDHMRPSRRTYLHIAPDLVSFRRRAGTTTLRFA